MRSAACAASCCALAAPLCVGSWHTHVMCGDSTAMQEAAITVCGKRAPLRHACRPLLPPTSPCTRSFHPAPCCHEGKVKRFLQGLLGRSDVNIYDVAGFHVVRPEELRLAPPHSRPPSAQEGRPLSLSEPARVGVGGLAPPSLDARTGPAIR